MGDDEREVIRNQHANYAKRNVAAVGGSANDNKESEPNPSVRPTQSNKRVNFADTASAEDFMSRGNRNCISQIRSGR
jgi:hypothetical protein